MLLYTIKETNSKKVLKIKPKIYYSNTKVIIILGINSKKVITKVIITAFSDSTRELAERP